MSASFLSDLLQLTGTVAAGLVLINAFLFLRYRNTLQFKVTLLFEPYMVLLVYIGFLLGEDASLWTHGVAVLVAVVLSLVTQHVLHLKVTRPIELLADAMRRARQTGELERLPALERRDELDDMYASYNALVEYLEATQRRQEEAAITTLQHAQQLEQALQEMAQTKAYQDEVARCLSDGIHRLAQGDLAVRLSPAALRTDVHRELFQAFNEAAEAMQRTVHGIIDSADMLGLTGEQLGGTTEQLAASSQEQSAQADEVSVAIEEMVRTIIENSRTAHRTADIAASGSRAAEEGAGIVQQTIAKIRDIAAVVKSSADTVQRLGASSKRIGEIVQVIDGIADQTNLLALNAAIEAARAGEQGRGFAVVADEVRKLAERTSSATKEIAGMIRRIQQETGEAVTVAGRGHDEVAEGIRLADRAGMALETIMQSARHTGDHVAHIAAASEQQSATSEQIARSVSAISMAAGEAARGTASVARSVTDLNRIAAELRSLVAHFEAAPAGRAALPWPEMAR